MIPIEQHARLKRRLDRMSRPTGDCRVWIGFTHNGYGKMTVGSKSDKSVRSAMAHRVAYEVFVGPIPEGMFVCHKCDNPPCINPDHLFTGTRQDNVDDRESKGRNKTQFPLYGENHYRARLTWAAVGEIRAAPTHVSNQALANRLHVARRTVSDVRRFLTWNLPDPPEVKQ